MADNNNNGWIWSAEYNDYYRVETFPNGALQYIFFKSQPAQPAQPQLQLQPGYHFQPPSSYPHQAAATGYDHNGGYVNGYTPHRLRQDSVYDPQNDSYPSYMPPSLDSSTRAYVPDLIPGTPGRGFYEPLDSSYMMRTKAHEFFTKGRVFAMMHVEAASEDAVIQNSHYKDSITVVRFGQRAFSQIRRFVVVGERQGFCYACPISTYSGQGTLKRGCNPAEHAVIYITGTTPQRLVGENGMTVDPIAVEPADPEITLKPASRVRLGKLYPIEWNVKVKDIGKVVGEDMGKLVTWSREQNPEMLGGGQ